MLVCKDFSCGIVFEQCAERRKHGIDAELTVVTDRSNEFETWRWIIIHEL